MQVLKKNRIFFAAALVGFALLALHAGAETAQAPVQTTETGLEYTSGWFGNTWGGGPKWVQTDINGLYVSPDGCIVTNSSWDEAHREVTIYAKEDGGIVAGVTQTTGCAVAANEKYVFSNVRGKGRVGVARHFRSEIEQRQRRDYSAPWTKPAPFEGGEGRDHNVVFLAPLEPYHWAAHVRRQEIAENPAAAEKYKRSPAGIKSMMCDGSELFVAEDSSHTIHVLDIETMKVKRTFVCKYPGAMTVDGDGNVWVVLRPEKLEKPASQTHWMELGEHRIVQYTREGEATGKVIREASNPDGLACGGPNEYLYVADSNPDVQQVLVYDISGARPRQISMVRKGGGIPLAAAPGTLSPDRFQRFSGIGIDAEGNLYVACKNGGSYLRRYDPQGNLVWQNYVGTFMNGSAFDPAYDGTVVYAGKGGTTKFVLDYARQTDDMGSWVAVTQDTAKFPHDRRSYSIRVHRLSNGKLYAYTHIEKNGTLILRKNEGTEIFQPSVFLSTCHRYPEARDYPPGRPLSDADGRFMWRDVNGNGQVDADEYVYTGPSSDPHFPTMDDDGGLWVYNPKPVQAYGGKVGIFHFELLGFDKQDNPLYDFDARNAEYFELPEPFAREGKIHRLQYEARSDTMYLFGDADGHKNTGGWGAGSLAIRYDDWSKTTRTIRCRVELPSKQEIGSDFRSVYVVGELLAAGLTRINKQGQVYLYNMQNGKFLGAIKPGPLLYGETSLIDIPWGVGGFLRENGEYIITVENNWKNLQEVFRIRPQEQLPKDAQPSGLARKRPTPSVMMVR